MSRSLAILSGFITLCIHVSAQDTVRVTDLGYKPGSKADAVGYVKKALERCKGRMGAVLVFPKGRYDFYEAGCEERSYFESNTDVIPTRRCAIVLAGCRGLVVDGKGSELVFHGRVQPFTVDSSEGVTIRNFSVDWDVPLTAQGQVKEVKDDHIDLAINRRESPYVIEGGKLVFTGEGWKSAWWGTIEFDRMSKLIPPGSGDGCLGDNWERYRAEEIGPGLVRLHYAFGRKPAVGNFLVLRHSARDHAGVFIINSRNTRIRNFNLYHTAGLGILSQYSSGLSFHGVRCVPNAAKGRYFSGHDDGMHFSNCKGFIDVDSCAFKGLMDDPINVHGTSVQVIRKLSERRLLCKFMHEQSIGFIWAERGDTVGLIENETMWTMGKAVVDSFVRVDDRLFEVSFVQDLDGALAVGDALENLTWTPSVRIRNSFFGSNRARGILVSTPGKVLIESNTFESSGSAILIPGDANGWFESGAVTDVVIRNNVFREACLTSMYQFCEGIISIDPEIPKLDPARPFHRNIRIEHNVFHPIGYPVLYAKSAQGLHFINNSIVPSAGHKVDYTIKSLINTEACLNVEIKDKGGL